MADELKEQLREIGETANKLSPEDKSFLAGYVQGMVHMTETIRHASSSQQ